MRIIRLIALLVVSSILLRDTQPVATQAFNCPNAPTSRLVVGREAMVTPGTPNNLREQPSRSAKLVAQIPGNSILFVLLGPTCADGFIYWQVDFNGKIGWTAEGSGNSYFINPLSTPLRVFQVTSNSKTVAVQYGQVSFIYNGALGSHVEASRVFEAKPIPDNPLWYPTPEYTEFRFGNIKYGTIRFPQAVVNVYPLPAYMKVNDSVRTAAGGLAAALKAQQLPQTSQDSKFGPIPPVPGAQVFRAQIKFLKFNGGNGVRFLTMYSMDAAPLTNSELVYVYQGLTDDGNYVVSAQFHLRTDALPDKHEDVKDFPEISSNAPNLGDLYDAYWKKTIGTLNGLRSDAYQPNLDNLDAILQSIVIK